MTYTIDNFQIKTAKLHKFSPQIQWGKWEARLCGDVNHSGIWGSGETEEGAINCLLRNLKEQIGEIESMSFNAFGDIFFKKKEL